MNNKDLTATDACLLADSVICTAWRDNELLKGKGGPLWLHIRGPDCCAAPLLTSLISVVSSSNNTDMRTYQCCVALPQVAKKCPKTIIALSMYSRFLI